MPKISFLGAARTVTGSKHLLSARNHRVLIDCGLYQGMKKLRLMNWDRLPFEASAIDSIVITHAHIDHTGFLPRLVKGGYRGRIIATPPTCDILKILLPDSARLQEEEARYANKKGSSRHAPALPLYTEEDAKATLGHLKPLPLEETLTLAEGIGIRFREAGHILGSAMVEATVDENGSPMKIVFSGDLGRPGTPILKDPAMIEDADFLVLESTYGDRLHTDKDRKDALAQVVRESLKSGGTLLIPAFAVERTQEILYILRVLKDSRDIPNAPVYIDSPMALGVTKVFSKYRESYDEEARKLTEMGAELWGAENVNFCESVEESKALNSHKGPMIIISASGMATGGRILHHLAQRLPDKRCTVLLVGYQAVGTRGNQLQGGADSIKIFGEHVPVKARIASLDGFSSHADYSEILSWLGNFRKGPHKVFLVHGEPESQSALRARILEKYGWTVEIPGFKEEFSL